MTGKLHTFDYSRIFYGVSAFFAVLSVIYFGFEYIQNLSPFTIAVIIFAVFAVSFIKGTVTDSRGVRFMYYLISSGSYIAFLGYVNARLISTEDGVLLSLIASALLFSAIGYLLTNKEKYLPTKEQSKKIFVGVVGLLVLLVAYDVAAVEYEGSYSLEEQVAPVSGEESTLGYFEIVKHGYLPVDVERVRASYCLNNGTQTFALGGTNLGGYTSGYLPETRNENLTLRAENHVFERIGGFDSGDELEIVEAECSQRDNADLEEGKLGVEMD